MLTLSYDSWESAGHWSEIYGHSILQRLREILDIGVRSKITLSHDGWESAGHWSEIYAHSI